MRYYLAIDIGASSGRHIVAHLENGKMITEEIYRFQNGPEDLTGFDGEPHLMWTHERLFGEILNGLKKAKELGKVPYSVGISALTMAGLASESTFLQFQVYTALSVPEVCLNCT